MTIFRWTNCYADVLTSKHDLTIRSYLDDVIYPALATIEHKIAELGRSDWPGHRFAQSDMEDMLQEAKLAFGLSIQSIWERQLRSYLRGCAFELRKDDPIGGRIDKADWKDLQRLFRLLRGIELESFPDFPTLDALQHLGNACRHGDGASARWLADHCPDLWPAPTPPPPGFDMNLSASRPVAAMDIPLERLRSYAEAIAGFWRDTAYIYRESINRKDAHLEAQLAGERRERPWVPRAASATD